MESRRIALFPLDVVLFPGMELPLHIFEPRYKLMIRRCLEKRIEFGVILARAEGIASVGCTASIVKIAREYEDGRMDIVTKGQTRFRVATVFDERPYLEADAEYLEENAQPPAATTSRRLLDVYKQCYALVFDHPAEMEDAEPGEFLAFQMAALFPLDLETKQAILEAESEEERQSHLIEQLDALRPQLARSSRVRRKARGNGHGVVQ